MRRFIVLFVVVAMVMVIVPAAAANGDPVGGCPDPGGPGSGAQFMLADLAEYPDFGSADRNADGWVCIVLTPFGHGRPGLYTFRTAIDNNLPLG